MAGRNGPVEQTAVRIPDLLKELIIRYQIARELPSFNGAVRELIETHPAIAEIVQRLYAEAGSL